MFRTRNTNEIVNTNKKEIVYLHLHHTAFGNIENCDALPRTTVEQSLLSRRFKKFTFNK